MAKLLLSRPLDVDCNYMQEVGFPDSIVPNTDTHEYRSGVKRKAGHIAKSFCIFHTSSYDYFNYSDYSISQVGWLQ